MATGRSSQGGCVKQALTVVRYHYVRPLERTRFPTIKALHVNQFRQQLEYIRRFYSVVSMVEVLAAASGAALLPPRACLLTFDDAYLDHWVYVFPILHDAGLSGAFYPTRRAVIERRLLEVNKVHFILAALPDKEMLASEINRLAEAARDRFDFASLSELATQYGRPSRFDPATVVYIKRMLQHALPKALRAEIADGLFRRFVSADETAFAEELYMSIDQARTMQKCGMHFGGHGSDHLWLSRLAEEEQAQEIDGSSALLTQIGVPGDQRSFCFPYGDYDATTLRLLTDRGYRVAFTTKDDLAYLEAGRLLELPRLATNDLPTVASNAPNEWTARVLGE